MKKTWMLFVVALIFSCHEENDPEPEESCTISATVVDLNGLDGCGFVFELANGDRLEPVRILICRDGLLIDPLGNFEFVNGKKVLISYELTSGASVCMVGKAVVITCISDLGISVEH